MTDEMNDAIELMDAFEDYLPLTAVRLAPGEYRIMSREGDRLWDMEGAALADWICASASGYSGMRRQINSLLTDHEQLVKEIDWLRDHLNCEQCDKSLVQPERLEMVDVPVCCECWNKLAAAIQSVAQRHDITLLGEPGDEQGS